MQAATAEAGHNSGISADRLKSFIARIERLETDKKDVSDDIKEVFSECKGAGYDIAIVRKIISLRKKSDEDRKQEAELLELYASALGMPQLF